jgi:hypothetical protein
MKRATNYSRQMVVSLLAYVLIAQLAFALPNESPSCSKPVIDAKNSSVIVTVQQSTVHVDKTIKIAAHKEAAFSLPLEKDSMVIAQFQVEGGLNNKVRIMLLDLPNFQRYQAHQKYSSLNAATKEIQRGWRYGVKAPKTDVYNLVVDNSEAVLLPREVKLYVFSIAPNPDQETEAAEKTLTPAFNEIGRMFIFPTFKVQVARCGLENAFSTPNITLCAELIESLHAQHLDQAIAFVYFHELGHTLMKLWGLPLSDNEDMADEFATVCMIMAKQQQPALQAAEWFESKASEKEAITKIWVNDRHTLSPQRARNVIGWLNQPDDLLQRWVRLMTPHLQSNALQALMKDQRLTPAKDVMQAEFQHRGCAAWSEANAGSN